MAQVNEGSNLTMENERNCTTPPTLLRKEMEEKMSEKGERNRSQKEMKTQRSKYKKNMQ